MVYNDKQHQGRSSHTIVDSNEAFSYSQIDIIEQQVLETIMI